MAKKNKKENKRSNEATVVGLQVTASTLDLLRRLNALGLVEGKPGKQALAKEVQPLVDALLHVLAGGSVTLEVHTPGEKGTVNELRELLDEAVSHANALNKASGHHTVAMP